MSVGNYTLRKTYVDGDILSASDYVADHQQHIDNQNPIATGAYSDNVTQMRTKTDPGTDNAESLAATLAGELERLRFVVNEIKTKLNGSAVAQWYSKSWNVTVPNGTITTAKLADGATFSQYIRVTSTNVTVNAADTVLITQGITLTRTRARLRGTFSVLPLYIGGAGGADGTVVLKLKRAGTLIASNTLYLVKPAGGGSAEVPAGECTVGLIDNPGPGTYSYTLEAIKSSGDWTIVVDTNTLELEEVV